jgi:hypothetical protein
MRHAKNVAVFKTLGIIVRQGVNGRAEGDLSSPFSRVNLLKVRLRITHPTRRQKEMDGNRRQTNPYGKAEKNGEGSLARVSHRWDR